MKVQILTLLGAAALSGCMSAGPVPVDRVFTDVERDGVTITGRYDPAGFSSAEVQRLVANVCTRPGISGFSETPSEGQMLFQFMCVNGNSYGANAGVNFQRTGAGVANLSAVFSDQNGNLASATDTVRF